MYSLLVVSVCLLSFGDFRGKTDLVRGVFAKAVCLTNELLAQERAQETERGFGEEGRGAMKRCSRNLLPSTQLNQRTSRPVRSLPQSVSQSVS